MKRYKQGTIKRYVSLCENKYFMIPFTLNDDNFMISSSMKDTPKWKCKTVLANNGGKVGKIDNVGYVAINLTNNEIIPISRSDEHQQGYKLLWYYQGKKIITNVKDWLNVFSYSNYIDRKEDIKDWLVACKKWISYGGSPDTILNSSGYNGLPTWKTTFEDFIKYKGHPPTTFKGTSTIKKEGQKIIYLIETLARMLNTYRKSKRDNPKIYQFAKKIILWDKKLGLESPWFDLVYSLGNWTEDKKFIAEATDIIRQAVESSNVQMIEELIFGMNGFKNLMHRGLKYYAENYDNIEERNLIKVESIFGDIDKAVEEFNRLGGI